MTITTTIKLSAYTLFFLYDKNLEKQQQDQTRQVRCLLPTLSLFHKNLTKCKPICSKVQHSLWFIVFVNEKKKQINVSFGDQTMLRRLLACSSLFICLMQMNNSRKKTNKQQQIHSSYYSVFSYSVFINKKQKQLKE